MKAKEKHTQVLLTYLSNWDNKFPNKNGMAKVCGITQPTLYNHFTPAELDQILADGLELRKKHSAVQRSEVYKAMHDAALDGSVQAQDKFLDRTEGKVVDKIEHGFDSATMSMILSALPDEYAEKVKKALSSMITK